MVGHPVPLDVIGAHAHQSAPGQLLRQRLADRHRPDRAALLHTRESGPCVVRSGHEVAADVLGQRLDQGRDQLLVHAGNQPVEAVLGDLVEHLHRQVHGHPVGVRAGLELVGQRERQLALRPLRREVVGAHRLRALTDQQLLGEGQQVRVLAPGLLPPGVEVRPGDHLGRDPLVVELEERLVVGEDAAPPGPRLELRELLDQLAVGVEELVPGVPVLLDQRGADEQLARRLGVDPAERDGPARRQGYAVERHPLVGHRRAAGPGPPGLAVGALDQVGRGLLDLGRVDHGVGAGPQPGRLDELGRHHPLGVPSVQHRAGLDDEAGVAGAEVGAVLPLPHAHVREQAGQQRPVDLVVLGRVLIDLQAQRPGRLAQLGAQVLPLPDAQVVQELGLAPTPEGAAGELLLLALQVAPQVEQDDEVGVDRVRRRLLRTLSTLALDPDRLLAGTTSVLPGVRRGTGAAGLPCGHPPGSAEPRVRLVGLLLLVGGSLPDVLDGQRGHDDQHLLQRPLPLGLDEHPGQAGVDRQPDDGPTVGGDPLARQVRGGVGVDGLQLGEQAHAVGDLAGVRRLEEGELLDLAQPQAGHLQDDAGQVGAQDLGIGELRAALEVLLGVEPDRDAVREPPAASGPLVGRGLADRLDREPLDLEPLAVAGDARGAGVHDIPDPRDGQRGLGHIGRHHDPAAGVSGEDPVLLGGGQATVERQDLGAGQPHTFQGVDDVPDLALAGAEDQHVLALAVPPGRLGPQLLDRLGDAGDLVDLDLDRLGVGAATGGGGLAHERPVADLDRVGPAADLDDRRGPTVGVGEVLGEALDVDGRGGDDDLEVGTLGQQLLEVAQDEVDVEAALVRLVDDQGVVAGQQPVPLQLGEQDAVGHHLEQRVLAGLVGEPHLVADRGAELDAQLLADPLGDRACRDPTGLGVADHPLDPAAQLEADLGQLGGLARAGLAGDDHDLVLADRTPQVLTTLADRQVRRVVQLVGSRQGGPPRLHLRRLPGTPVPLAALVGPAPLVPGAALLVPGAAPVSGAAPAIGAALVPAVLAVGLGGMPRPSASSSLRRTTPRRGGLRLGHAFHHKRPRNRD